MADSSQNEDSILRKIRRLCAPTLALRPQEPSAAHVVVGVGDDAAVILASSRPQLLCSDFTIENVHFDRTFSSPSDIGFKSLARPLSDIAAMAGRAIGVTISIALPKKWSQPECEEFLNFFYQGATEIASKTKCAILGGDFSRIDGPIVVDVAAFGETRSHSSPWLRSGAKKSDLAFVTGVLGGAGYALHEFQCGRGAKLSKHLAARHLRPVPRFDIAEALASCPINAAMDLSDGLAIDGPRLAAESKVSLHIDEAKIPLALSEIHELTPAKRLDFALNSGDDYELLLAIPRNWADSSEAKLILKNLGLVQIGHFG